MKGTESKLQKDCFIWFHNTYPELRGSMWMTYNNPKNAAHGAVLKGMGLVAGVSDVLWLHSGVLHCLELKKPSGRQSEAQKGWQRVVNEQGGEYVIIRSVEEFKNYVLNLLQDDH